LSVKETGKERTTSGSPSLISVQSGGGGERCLDAGNLQINLGRGGRDRRGLRGGVFPSIDLKGKVSRRLLTENDGDTISRALAPPPEMRK